MSGEVAASQPSNDPVTESFPEQEVGTTLQIIAANNKRMNCDVYNVVLYAALNLIC